MEAADHAHHGHHGHGDHHHHHEMPTEGRALTGVAVSATLHCLTGCAIGEVLGMVIGTSLGFSEWGTVALAVGLAFLFGYTLTSLPLLRAGLAISAVIPIALAADTLSIATMEIVDNAVMLLVPGAMDSGVGSILFWGALSFALAVAFVVTVPVNRWLIARGRGHVAVHETGIHGGPPTKYVAAATIAAAVFGTAVLVAEVLGGGEEGHGHEPAGAIAAAAHDEEENMNAATASGSGGVAGLAVTEGGLELELGRTVVPRLGRTELAFRIADSRGEAVREFEVEHEKRMHLIVVRRDLSGFQHLHPEMTADGTWSTPIEFDQGGSYRVFADFVHDGAGAILGADLHVEGAAGYRELPPDAATATTGTGYEVELQGAAAAGSEAELAFTVSRGGEPVHVQPYLGADGHLVALREGDLAYLHVHPAGHDGHEAEAAHDDAIRFVTEFPSEGRYRLFLQFRHEGRVHTAEFTREVAR